MYIQTMPQYAAVLFTLASIVVCAFQVAIALGAPWGEFTLGGRWRGQLPIKIRFIALISLFLLAFFSAVVLARANLAFPPLHEYSFALVWLVVGYCALGCVANAITPSRRERKLWLPVVLCMFVLSLVIATS